MGKYRFNEEIPQRIIFCEEVLGVMKKNQSKKIITALFVFALLFTFVPQAKTGFANTIGGLKDNLSNVKDEREEVKNEMMQVVANINALKNKVDALTNEINYTITVIEQTEDNIAKKQEEIQSQETNLNARLVVMYKNGSIGFVDVLLGSNSISEFIYNIDMIKKIYQNDIEVLKKLQKEQKELEEIKKRLKEKRIELKKQKEDLSVRQEELDAEKKKLEQKEKELKAEADALISKIKALQDAQRKYAGGALAWPVPSSSYITSSFGRRIHPIFKKWSDHTGTDIGATYGAAIIAANDGKVIMSQWYGGYGKCIIIDHGGGIVTLYGHCSSLLVSVGQEVKRGQTIAKIGSTGNSTGNHLHFEVRKNGAYVDPMSYYKKA